ncbi:MAG: phage portal protein [Actinomycetota bacterium]
MSSFFDFFRARSRDDRPTVPQPIASVPTGSFATFGEIVESDQADISGQSITESKLRGLPAANFAVNKIANAVASMSPLRVVDDEDETVRVTPTPLVAKRPMPTLGTFDFWHSAISHALRQGNFVALPVDFDEPGFPRQVLPIHSDFVSCHLDRAGYTVYEILGNVFSAEQVLHVRGPHTIVGQPWALSPVAVFAQSLGLSLDIQRYASNSFRSGSVPSVIISLDTTQDPPAEVVERIQTQWINRHGSGQRRPAVTPKTMNVETVGWSPHDSELIEAMKLDVATMAMVFDLEPADLSTSLGGDSTMTYENLSDRQNARIVDVFGPWMRRFEEAWSDLLPEGQCSRFDPERTMRMNATKRAELQRTRIESGVTTVDEERAAEGREPIQTTEEASNDE